MNRHIFKNFVLVYVTKWIGDFIIFQIHFNPIHIPKWKDNLYQNLISIDFNLKYYFLPDYTIGLDSYKRHKLFQFQVLGFRFMYMVALQTTVNKILHYEN